jgi:hypothetical protein
MIGRRHDDDAAQRSNGARAGAAVAMMAVVMAVGMVLDLREVHFTLHCTLDYIALQFVVM